MTIAAGSSLRRFRNNQLVQSFLRGVTPAVVGLLVAAAITIGRAGIHTSIGLLLGVAAAGVLVRFRPNPFRVIIGAVLFSFSSSNHIALEIESLAVIADGNYAQSNPCHRESSQGPFASRQTAACRSFDC